MLAPAARVAAGVAACVLAALLAGAPGWADVSAVADVREMLVEQTNAERTRAGLPALRTNGRLMEAAQIQAEQMARARRVDHVIRSAAHATAQDRLAAAGYTWAAYGENVASGAPDAARAVKGWMASPGHRANILNASYHELGTGYAVDTTGRPYYVEVFGRPAR